MEPRKHVLYRGAHWRHLANTTEPCTCGDGDAAFLFKYFDHLLLLCYHCIVNKDYQQSVVLLRCDTADVTRRWRGVFSASQKSEHPLVSHLYNIAAQSLVSDVVDHVTIQLRALDVTRLVSHLLRVIRDVHVQPAQNHGQDVVLGISDGVSRLSRDMVFHVSVLAVSRHLYVSSWLVSGVSMSRHVSCRVTVY